MPRKNDDKKHRFFVGIFLFLQKFVDVFGVVQ